MRKKQVCPCLTLCTAPTCSCVFVRVVLSKKKKKCVYIMYDSPKYMVDLPKGRGVALLEVVEYRWRTSIT